MTSVYQRAAYCIVLARRGSPGKISLFEILWTRIAEIYTEKGALENKDFVFNLNKHIQLTMIDLKVRIFYLNLEPRH